jgi:hypothetical protein
MTGLYPVRCGTGEGIRPRRNRYAPGYTREANDRTRQAHRRPPDARPQMVNDLDAGSVRVGVDEALVRLRVEWVEATQRLQQEIGIAANAVEVQQRQLEHLERRLTELTAAAEATAAARRRTEQELARMRATFTWRLRNHLLGRGAVRLGVRWGRGLKRVL